jgi:cysteine-rich repeat protein
MMRQILTLASLLILAACSGTDGGIVVKGNDATDVGTAADLRLDPDLLNPIDAVDPAETEIVETPIDLQETAPGCEAGAGCFLDPCDGPDDCLSGLCLDHMGDSVCSMTCVEECPAGWLCEQIGAGPDLNFACVSPFTHLCRPCHTSADCESATGVEDVCVTYGDSGSFCGAHCQAGDCPSGYTCQDATTSEGTTLKQCISDAGVCSCSQKAVLLALTTPCSQANDAGECLGVRTCTDSGLTACDAPEPLVEECNGVDDDCNGELDDVSCDDGNLCTEDSCDPDVGCQHSALTGTECADGDVCTLADHCEEGVCVGTNINCDDGNVCTTDGCDPTGGCLYSFNISECDDDDPCTVNDTCGQGLCAGFDIQCDCLKDSDCVPLEDGDVCNGTLVCDTDTVPYECATDPDTAVTCPAPSGPNASCLAASCHPVSGECSTVPANEDSLCSDGDACTIGERCVEGTCQDGIQVNCNDGNLCTDDSCVPGEGCLHEANAAPCSDGDACTTGDSCANGSCQASGVLACDDSNPCTADSCDQQSGCVHAPTDAACDDGNDCTLVDQCTNSVCVGSLAPDCDDENICTTDSCDPATGCVHGLNQAPCDDGDICTTGDLCQLGECFGAGTLPCNDNNACTDDSCLPLSGCSFSPNKNACDDKNPCTTGDQCQDGQCAASGWVDCDDQNVCTTDYCEPPIGCVNEPNLKPCDDGNACTLGDVCANEICQPGPESLVCDDGNPCTDDACVPEVGCNFEPNTDGCSDGSACTVDDTCGGGQCLPGAALVCDDGDDCTTDSCTPESGCITTPITPCCGNGQVDDGEECDDGNDVDNDFCANDCQSNQPLVPGFSGELGPVFQGWVQCEGYLDKPGGNDIPKEWGDDCTAGQYNKMKMVCGANLQSYRYIDVSKNVFKDGLTGYSQTGLISGANFSGYENIIYADGNHPHNSTSWWGGPSGCGENNTNTTVNNGCSWEASNCFGQNLGGNRYLWLYVAP